MIKPNLAQKQALKNFIKSDKNGNNKFLVVLPSGLGKTIYSSLVVKKMSGNILYLVHRKEILDQAMKEFEKTGYNKNDFGLLVGDKKEFDKKYTFATIQSLSVIKTLNKFKKNNFKFIILDEFHHARAKTYERILKYFNGYKLLGLTATPFRLDGKNVMKTINDNLIYNMNIREGIENGLLSSFKYYGIYDNIDYSDIKWSGYRYTKKDLNRKLLITKRDLKIVAEAKKHLINKQTIGFCVSIEHVDRCVNIFNKAGFKSSGITYKTKSKDRKKIINDFRTGKIQMIFTRDIFNEGINFPEVRGLLFLRPTVSKTIFLQQLGRGLRKSRGKKEVIVLDFIGNYVNAWKIRKWLGEIVNKGGKRKSKPIYDYVIPEVNFDMDVIKIFETQEERNVTKEKLINEYFRMKKLLDRRPLYTDFCYKDKEAKYSSKAYENYFGSWTEFLKSIGEPCNASHKRINVNEKILIEYYNKVKQELGRVPKAKDMTKYTINVYCRFFNMKWSEFKVNIGDDVNIVLEDFKKIYFSKKKLLGRSPMQKDWKKVPNGLGLGIISKRYGSWKKFIEKIGEETNRELKNRELFESYLKAKNKMKRIPTGAEFTKISGKYYQVIYYKYKNWEDFCNKMEDKIKNEKN